MTRNASVALVGGSLLLVWVFASGAPRPASEPQRDPPPARPSFSSAQTAQKTADDLAREAARLREYLAAPRSFPLPTRDPFLFAAHPAPLRAHAPVANAAPVAPPEIVVPTISDLPRLVAVLADASDGGPIRRAVLSAGDDVQVLLPGEIVSHYRVRSIGSDAVELVDTVTGIVTRVVLR